MYNRAFTLLEVLVVLLLLSTLVVLMLLLSIRTFTRAKSGNDTEALVSLLGKARSNAQNGIAQSSWGLCFDEHEAVYVLFRNRYTPGESTNEKTTATAGTVLATPAVFACDMGGVVFTALSATTTAVTITLIKPPEQATVHTTYEGAII